MFKKKSNQKAIKRFKLPKTRLKARLNAEDLAKWYTSKNNDQI